MICAIHQSHYLPWQGYLGKVLAADVFVVLDTVQFVKNEWMNRNRVRTAEGWTWLTVPVHYRFPQTILDTKISREHPWGKKHLKTLGQLYSKAPYFEQYCGFFEDLYARCWERLADLNMEAFRFLLDTMAIRTEIHRASEINISNEDATGRLVDICKELGAETYLAGQLGRNYMDVEQFERAGIEVRFQRFEAIPYPQVYPGFEPALSSVDALLCCGPTKTRELIERGSRFE